MAVLNRKQGFYVFMGGWMRWYGPEGSEGEIWDSMPDEGWKLHVGGTAATAQQILDVAAPVLQSMNMPHKVLRNTDEFANFTGEQSGKWFAAYPNSIISAFLAVYRIDEEIRRVRPRWNHASATTNIPFDRPVGSTVMYARYGAYRLDVLKGPLGPVVDNRLQTKPAYIRDPWIGYNQMASSYTGVAPLHYFEPFPKYSQADVKALERFSNGLG